MKSITQILALLLILVGLTAASAWSADGPDRDPVILSDAQQKYPLGLHLEYLEDAGGELTIEQVSSPEFDDQFTPSQDEAPNFGLTDSVYWVRIPLHNEALHTDQWLLDVGSANTHFVDMYSPLPNGDGFTVKQSGNFRPVETRYLRHPRIVFDVALPAQSSRDIYLRFQNGAAMSLLLTLWRPTDFLVRSAQEQALHALYFGILLGLLAYNALLLISVRDANHLILVFLLANMIVFDAIYLGYTEIYVAPGLYSLRPYLFPLSYAFVFLSMDLFADSFLELRRILPMAHRATLVTVAVWGILILLIPFTTYHTIAILMAPWALVSMALVLLAGLATWMQGYRPARFFLIAWFGFVVAFILVGVSSQYFGGWACEQDANGAQTKINCGDARIETR